MVLKDILDIYYFGWNMKLKMTGFPRREFFNSPLRRNQINKKPGEFNRPA